MSHRKLKSGTLIVASHNQGKAREIAELLAPFNIGVKSAAELMLPEPEETGQTFGENAELKARVAARECGLPALADDSGLCVDALSGQPGIHSARWAGPSKDFSAAMARVYKELETLNVKNPRARFICALSLAWPDGHVETCLGRVDGALVFPPRGTKGFGYDPIFMSDGYDMTFGEMEPGEKHKISHRARAFQKLIKACLDG